MGQRELKTAHIGGERAAAFRRLVAGVDPTRVPLVGVDVAKATWFDVVRGGL